jgi:PKD repeat protein
VSTPNHGELPLTVQFTERSSGSSPAGWGLRRRHDLERASPAHVYGQAGSYDVRLTVTGPGGTDTLLRQRAEVVQPSVDPVRDFAGAPTSGPAPLSVVVQRPLDGHADLVELGLRRRHRLEPALPEAHVSQVGTYTVSLTVTGPLGLSNQTAVDFVTASEPPPAVGFSAAPLSGSTRWA